MAGYGSIKERHEKLYEVFVSRGEELDTGEYRDEVRDLIEDIKTEAGGVTKIGDYVALRTMVELWRIAGPAVGVPVRVVLVPPGELSAQTQEEPWSDHRLEEWVRTRSEVINRYRALEWLAKLPVDEVVRQYREHLRPDEAGREQDEDWYQAETYLANHILDGRLPLITAIGPESFWRLEGKGGRRWLDEVKLLKAYLRWQKKGGGWGVDQERDDYQQAVGELYDSLANPERKLGKSVFEPVQRYFERHFLDATGKLARSKAKEKHALQWAEVKSERLRQRRVAQAEARDMAKRFMEKYYENIVSAAIASDRAATDRVLEALGLLPGFEQYAAIVNCFEMAVAISFLDPDLVRAAERA